MSKYVTLCQEADTQTALTAIAEGFYKDIFLGYAHRSLPRAYKALGKLYAILASRMGM